MSPLLYFLGAVLYAIPSTAAAVLAYRNGRKTAGVAIQAAGIERQLTTGNDLTVAEMVEDSHAKLSRDDRDFDKHHPSGPLI